MGLSKTRANSSFIGSELESSLMEEEPSESAVEGAPSWLKRLLMLAPLRKALYYITDKDAFEEVKPRRVVKIYRLLGLKSTTPQELFAVKVSRCGETRTFVLQALS